MSSPEPRGTSPSKPNAASSFRLRGRSSWNPSARFGSANPDETFLSWAQKTSYGGVLEERMEFNIGVDKKGIASHHCIVVSNAEHGHVSLELCLNEKKRIIPMCRQFKKVEDVTWKKKVECSLKDLAEEAMNIWYSRMGSYNLIGSNCQDFCNYFLESMDAPQYRTTLENATTSAGLIGTGLVVGTGLLALLAVFVRR